MTTNYPDLPERIESEDAIRRLNELDVSDPEGAHSLADEIVLRVVPPEVLAAYDGVVARAGWWAWA